LVKFAITKKKKKERKKNLNNGPTKTYAKVKKKQKNKKLLPSRPFSGRYDSMHITFSVKNDEDVMRSVAMIER